MKAYAKANIFLKLIGLDSRKYHLLSSRFILLEEFYDELCLSDEKTQEGFEIISDFRCKDNIIKKAYCLLCDYGYQKKLEELFQNKSLKLIKNIPTGAGLGGGSSDCATFLVMMNEILNLKLSIQELIALSTKLGSDIAFFLSGFKSANVSGCGEIINVFEDEIPNINWIFPQIFCNTSKVYKEFDKKKCDFNLNIKQAKIYENLSTKELLQEYKNTELNDLFTPCVSLYPKMSNYLQNNYFLSGSGSSVFKVDR
ncbi:4-(cytidine 5'-diphospho)-2-C-methyl-D-erythritol kinase [Campylobacter estrildidarum]|uniref:4-(cytidine 5'-diphospho)-2-C-methyl-D-erythritol kinase n=1 Tax=Campylobacter estrildidarum TaxID=2510189 RepID=A0A4U7BT55_9BACT|nr:4-(cytidine 5'-diphospho)-2-C-methyl-D-erythritol kinase [Campylobacter estrildidarum]TKX32044.1 4-(cytidine 5'-diphospho)-2-C-methyl-D-erythritol kinase [Campylobacter estrildidarum]